MTLVVTGYHWLPEVWSQGSYQLELLTRILFSGWLPVTTHISLLLVTIGYQRVLHPPVTGYHRLPACPILAGYRLPAVTKKTNCSGNRPVTMVTRKPENRTCRPLFMISL